MIITTQIWSSATAKDGYLIVKGRLQSSGPITGVQSCVQVDLTVYDKQDTFRNTLQGNVGGETNWWEFNVSGQPVKVAPITAFTSPTTPTVNSWAVFDDVMMSAVTGVLVPPHTTPKVESYFLFWSGATGTGNVLAMCKCEDFVEFSIVPSQTIF